MAKQSVYEMVTEKIMEQLEQGVIPWRKPWLNGGAVNWKTQKAYRGVNQWLLPEGEYLTFNQIKEQGGKVKKGAKSHIVVFWKWIEKEDKEGNEEKIPLLRYYRVFEINTQVEGIDSKRKKQTFHHDKIEACENIVKGYMGGPDMTFERTGAWYKPFTDTVNVPPMSDFPEVEEFYSTLFHELGHSTGHQTRLNREGITKSVVFGDEDYSKEELVAEMTATFLCAEAGIENKIITNSASYIQSWLNALKEDKTLIVKASAQAQKASDYILNITHEAKKGA